MTETLLASCSELQTEISKTSNGNWLLWSLSHFANHYYITPKDDIDRAILIHQNCWQRCVTSFYCFIVINGEDVFNIQLADVLHKACKILLVSLIPQLSKAWKTCQRFANSVFVMVAFHAQVDVSVYQPIMWSRTTGIWFRGEQIPFLYVASPQASRWTQWAHTHVLTDSYLAALAERGPSIDKLSLPPPESPAGISLTCFFRSQPESIP